MITDMFDYEFMNNAFAAAGAHHLDLGAVER